jgi:PAS domain S-box-containing protein
MSGGDLPPVLVTSSPSDACKNEHDLWQSTFDAILDPVFILDQYGVIAQANKATGYLIQKSLDTIVGKQCYEVMHSLPDYIDDCPFARLLNSKARETKVLAVGSRYYKVAVDPVFGHDGEVSGAVHHMMDITDRIEAEKTEAFLASIVESSDEAVIGVDLEGKVRSWNPAAARMFGFSYDEVLDKDLSLLNPGISNEKRRLALTHIEEGVKVDHFETKRRRKDGSEIDVIESITPLRDRFGTVVGAAVVVHDITEHKRALQTLIAYITESALRLKLPVELIAQHLIEVREQALIIEGRGEDIALALTVQIKSAEQVVENLRDLNRAITEAFNEIPEAYRIFLSR